MLIKTKKRDLSPGAAGQQAAIKAKSMNWMTAAFMLCTMMASCAPPFSKNISGTWSGATEKGDKIQFTIAGGAVTHFGINLRSGGYALDLNLQQSKFGVHGNRFSFTHTIRVAGALAMPPGKGALEATGAFDNENVVTGGIKILVKDTGGANFPSIEINTVWRATRDRWREEQQALYDKLGEAGRREDWVEVRRIIGSELELNPEKIRQDFRDINFVENAVRGGQTDLVRELLKRGASPSGAGQGGVSPLIIAVIQNKADMVLLLLDAGADKRYSVLNGAKEGRTEMVRILLSHNGDANDADELGKTALMYAAAWGRADTVRLLLQLGADPNRRDHQGQTAADYAALQGHTDIVRLLRDK